MLGSWKWWKKKPLLELIFPPSFFCASLCLEMFLCLLCVSKALITSDEPTLALFPYGSFDTIILFEKEANILLS